QRACDPRRFRARDHVGTTLATKITSRDFKRARAGGMRFELSRFREFGLGLALGLSLSLCVLVWENYRERNLPPGRDAPHPEPRPNAVAAEADEGAKYDFYEMLPNFEVVVPEKDREVASERDSTPAHIERPGVYVLQAGSYRAQSEADRIRAQLKMQG